MFAETSHSENNGSVSERRCRQCAVGPTIQSLTHSAHRTPYQTLLFFIPLAKSYFSGSRMPPWVRTSGWLSVQTCALPSVCWDFSPAFTCSSRHVFCLSSCQLSITPPSVCPLGWWTSCGPQISAVSEGSARLSACGTTHTHADPPPNTHVFASSIFIPLRLRKSECCWQLTLSFTLSAAAAHHSLPPPSLPTFPACSLRLYYDRWSISPQLRRPVANSGPYICVRKFLIYMFRS